MGYSSILMTQNLPPGGKITTLEINSELAKIARDNIKKAGLTGKIKVQTGNAMDNIKKIRSSVDLLFLDATKEEYFAYLREAEKILSPRALVVADNVGLFAEQMADFLGYIRGKRQV